MIITELETALANALRRKSVSKLYCTLAHYGNPEVILNDALKELKTRPIYRHDDLALTPKYLIDLSRPVRAVIPLESALWVFRMQYMCRRPLTKNDVMHYAMRIYTITGDIYVLKNRSKEDFDEIEAVLTDRYPNFFYGYSKEHDEMVHYILSEQKREIAEKKREKK
ncbi:MAG: hypothetical protein IK088_05830 [Lachnospiraceae bacterium]|nr:hypothetical protein [Lachnospiraceae bacterium]